MFLVARISLGKIAPDCIPDYYPLHLQSTRADTFDLDLQQGRGPYTLS